MRIAYLDCFAGISGDMLLGALLGAGVPLRVLQDATAALDLGASLEVETVDRSGISSCKVHVLENGRLAEPLPPEQPMHTHRHAPGHEHPHTAAPDEPRHQHPQDHPQEHPQEHPHAPEHAPAPAHPHEHTHPHDHAHPHEHEHLHAHDQVQPHEHEHEHAHEHAAAAAPPHEHAHDHEHAHEHAHPHTHKHEQAREHAGAPAHDHAHPHDHEHPHDHAHPHAHGRSLSAIRERIQAARLPEPVKARAIRAFELLGRSEAKIHNAPVEQIHFHEVGAVDAIVDIVAACAGIEHLAAEGPVAWYASPVNVGGGMVVCAHGTFPVPAPATADLLRHAPTYSAHIEKELVTPTGAALLRALDPEFGPQPAMRVAAIGYGAGTRNPRDFPNVLRLSIGEAATEARPEKKHSHQGDTVTVLETALDDATPQVLAFVAERALALGALDAMLTPVIMKKGRPGTLVTLLCNGSEAPALEQLLLRETSTLGVRMHREHRSCLDRSHTEVETSFGALRVKVGTRDGNTLNVAPEYEDCKHAAAEHGVPLKQVMQAALTAYARRGER